jgi:hypothetical protein
MMWRRFQIWLIRYPGTWIIDLICANVPSDHRGDLADLVGIAIGDMGAAKWQRLGDTTACIWYQGPAPGMAYSKSPLSEAQRLDLMALCDWDEADVEDAEWQRLTDAAPVEDPGS